jgi:hypothetical protein
LKRVIFWLDTQNWIRFVVKTFFVTAKLYWKASFTEIFLIEMYNFWSEYENLVHLVLKVFRRRQAPLKCYFYRNNFIQNVVLDPAMNSPYDELSLR